MTARQSIDLSRVRQIVAEALREEERTSRLRTALTHAYRQAAAEDADVIEAQLERLRGAIAAVPDQLLLAAQLDVGPKASARVRQVLRKIVAYWIAQNDIVPDDGGLLCRIDDALVSYLLLAKLCDWHTETQGSELTALRPARSELSR